MKKLFTLLATVTLSVMLFAQAPQSFSYQTVIRDASWQVLSNQNISLEISIIEDVANGTAIYTESHSATTNELGLVNLSIADGGVMSGSWSNIDWGNHTYFIEVAVDVTGGTSYIVMGTTQLRSVPYALYAETSGSSTPGPQGATGATGTAGANGVDGNDGNDGNDGADGNDGTNGINGLPGADGTNGVDGAVGATGPIGLTGATGPQGIDGAVGATGPTGNDGADGQDGADGATGPIGLTGATGPQGNDGADGATGPIGLTGATGPTGNDGADGVDGAVGATGPPGNDGADGATGLTGADGYTPMFGVDYFNGQDGVDGTNGTNGAVGATGATGADGQDGADGTNGTNGTNGTDGNGISTTVDNGDGTFTFTYTDGSTFTTSDLTGATGPQGIQGAIGNSIWQQDSVNNISYSGGNVTIGSTVIDSSAALSINSQTQGVMLPSMSETERDAIDSPTTGLLIFQNDGTAGFYYYNGTNWALLGGGGDFDPTLIYTTDGF